MFLASTRVYFPPLSLTHIHYPPIYTHHSTCNFHCKLTSLLISQQILTTLVMYLDNKMVDLDCKGKMVSPDSKPTTRSPKLSVPVPPPPVRATELSPASDTALHALEFTFRFVSTVLSDPRPYVNRREWSRRLESLATSQIELISLFCKPSELHYLTKSPPEKADVSNYENRTLYTTHQILECWIHVANRILNRIESEIDSDRFESASNNGYILEQIWKLLTEIEDLHLLMDPDDFLRLKNQLDIKTESESESFCFRSKALIEITKRSKNLRHKVPYILGVEVDPNGGPRIQEAAMKLYRRKNAAVKIHLLQSLQAVEAAVKKFYYAYKQLLVVVMGSVEAKGSLAFVTVDSSDSLGRIFLEPTYFPSLDGAKTFLGDYWSR
ncbi:putative nematode resistance protein-like HSPRO1 [Helianthus annuus]|nr:putative nematode resistance protein-like HSPRO1 [Helianthus annuus]